MKKSTEHLTELIMRHKQKVGYYKWCSFGQILNEKFDCMYCPIGLFCQWQRGCDITQVVR